MLRNIDRTLILSLFGVYTLKLLVLGASPADAAVVLVLAAAHFAYNSQIQSKKILELEQALKDIKSSQHDQNVSISEMKSIVMGIKLKEGMKISR